MVDGINYSVRIKPGDEALTISSSTTTRPVPNKSTGLIIDSPMAGKIIKILVQPGSKIKNGDTVMILEAMKMETEIIADTDGVIGSIMVQVNDVVSSGQPLISA